MADADSTDGIQKLVCSDVIKNSALSDVICDADYVGIKVELRRLIKWQVLMDEVR